MSSFTTRVQLDGSPSEADYEKLHLAMEKKGFSRTITSNDGVTYNLPHAEYSKSEGTRGEVADSAVKAIESISKKGKVLVTESAGRTWRNLDKI